jgi:hypothetical protein
MGPHGGGDCARHGNGLRHHLVRASSVGIVEGLFRGRKIKSCHAERSIWAVCSLVRGRKCNCRDSSPARKRRARKDSVLH